MTNVPMLPMSPKAAGLTGVRGTVQTEVVVSGVDLTDALNSIELS